MSSVSTAYARSSSRQGASTPFQNAAFAASIEVEEKSNWFDIDGGSSGGSTGAAPPAIAGGCSGDTATAALTNFIWMACAFSINHGVASVEIPTPTLTFSLVI